MVQLGYALSSEEHPPNDLVRYARAAEEAGFSFALISDHYHPWTDRQGQSPFVWSVIGGIAQATERLRLGTGVTCPTFRMHPAIIAQAAATSAAMMPGRFFLGVGSGEALNEHIVGLRWPSAAVRQDMLVEAIEIMRLLWQGGFQSYDGEYFLVEEARIYTLPETPPEIMIAAAGPRAATIAGQLGDGLIVTAPKAALVRQFEQSGGTGRPRIGQVTVCWAQDEAQARRTALEYWPNAALPGQLGQELPLPRHFEQATELVSEEQIASAIVCGPDPEKHAKAIQEYVDAGCDHVYVHQVGPDQQGFLDFYRREILPRFGA
uniref:TIGR03557 family F420-dependent LLM class oxidoreductase n=1 Tax=Thermorudis peleae TaxID=1382356 RepID=A0A831T9V4_9BACT